MTTQLNSGALKALRASQQAKFTVDGETARLMNELAKSAGTDVSTLLKRLALRYQNANFFEKKIVINFLNGV